MQIIEIFYLFKVLKLISQLLTNFKTTRKEWPS